MVIKTILTPEQIARVQEVIKKIVSSDVWDQATFLKIFRQQIQVLGDQFDKAALEAYSKDQLQVFMPEKDDKQLVYISIYSAEGRNMEAWLRVVLNLPKQYVSRPIYAKEEYAQYAARNKALALNEAYVAVWVDKNNIMPQQDKLFELKDKFDHPLLSLKDRSVDLKNMAYLWLNSSQYVLDGGRLIFLKSVDDFIY